MNSDFALVLPFDTDDPEFTRGVEVGMLWQRLNTERRPFTAMFHATNAEMVLRLADAAGCPVHAIDLDDNWMKATFEP